jgi:hypothetical protein
MHLIITYINVYERVDKKIARQVQKTRAAMPNSYHGKKVKGEKEAPSMELSRTIGPAC